ncbi:hypothetical protein JCM11641_005661 [Rhodosporidiobolus odoratus]
MSPRSSSPLPSWSRNRQYGVVIDAGSSGSRIQVYSWLDPKVDRLQRKGQGKSVDVLSKVEKGVEEGEGWHLKVEPGISTFGDNPEGVTDYLRPLIEHAASVIPSEQLSSTPIYLLATAGMRLLPQSQQEKVLTAACSYLRTYPFHLPDCSDQVRIISGEEEGLYGWIAVNYLMDGFDKHEHTSSSEQYKHSSTYGFLDMGGASTQIAFEPSDTEQVKHADNLLEVRLRLLSGKEVRHPVFVTTWLGFGTNQARNRYVDQEVKKHLRASDADHVPISLPPPLSDEEEDDEAESEHPVVFVEDPCLPKDLLLSETRHAGYTLKGTGDFAACLRRQQPLLNKEVACLDEPCLFNGVHVPPIDFSVNHFIGISEYWYSTQDVWGSALGGAGVYDYVAFEKHAVSFCSQTWDEIMRAYREGHGTWHPSVELSRLETQCFKAAWIVNVLHEGIGIPRIIDRGGKGDGRNQTEKGIEKAVDKGFIERESEEVEAASTKSTPSFQSLNEVGDVAISWTLGKMVLEVSKGSAELPSSASSSSSSTSSSSSSSSNKGWRGANWAGHIPSWKGDMRTTIASVKQSDSLPFLGIAALLLSIYLFVISPSAARRRKALCGSPRFGFGSPRRRNDFLPLSQADLGVGETGGRGGGGGGGGGEGSSGESSGSRTPPRTRTRGPRSKRPRPSSALSLSQSLSGRVLSPLRYTALRLSSVLRSWTFGGGGRDGTPPTRNTSAGSLLPLTLTRTTSDSDLFRPRPITIRSSKSTPFLRSLAGGPVPGGGVAVVPPPASSSTMSGGGGAGGYWNDAPLLPSSSSKDGFSGLHRSASGSALTLSIPSSSSPPPPPPMIVIPPSPLSTSTSTSRPTTPSSSSLTSRRFPSGLTPRTREASLVTDDVDPSSPTFLSTTSTSTSSTSASNILSPSPRYSSSSSSNPLLSNSLSIVDFPQSQFRQDPSSSTPTPGVGPSPSSSSFSTISAGAKLRASRSANSSRVDLAAAMGGGGGGGGGYFAGPAGGAGGGGVGVGGGGGPGGGLSASQQVSGLASARHTSRGVSPGSTD